MGYKDGGKENKNDRIHRWRPKEMSGEVVGMGILLMIIGILMLIFGIGGKGKVESNVMNVTGPVGLIVIGIGAILAVIGSYF